MSVRIVVDSSANVNEEIRDKLTIVPLTIRLGETEYLDRVTITDQEFYERLVESDELPTTSQASPDTFQHLFEEIVQQGDCAVVITISSHLSGTYQSAVIAAEDYLGKVWVVDSLSAAIGTGILTELALQLAESGMPSGEIAARLHEERERICVVALVDTLEYLKQGGRISKTVAFAGGLLSIKPVVSIKDGEVALLGKARGSKNGNNLLIGEIQKAGGVDFSKPLLLGYTGLSDALLQKYIADSQALWQESPQPLHTAIIGSVVGTHVGPGAVAVAFFKKGS